MKTKIIILLGSLLLIANNSAGQNWSKISKKIKQEQLRTGGLDSYINCYYNLRKKSNCLQKLEYMRNDTIFLLERTGDWSDLELNLSCWNRSDTILCESITCGKTYSFDTKHSPFFFFTKYMMKLVSEWNLEEIRKEDIKNGAGIPERHILATRIILDGKKYQIDCIRFRDFFDLKRDSMDFTDDYNLIE